MRCRELEKNMRQRATIASLFLVSIMLGASGCAKTETPATSGALTDDETENVVRRSYQYAELRNCLVDATLL